MRGSVCTQSTPNPPILAIDKHQVRPLHPGSAWAEPPGPVDLSWHFSPRRRLSGFRTREGRGASVGAGYSRGAPGRRASGPSRKGYQARPFLAPGLSQGARTRDRVHKVSANGGASPLGPCSSQAPGLHLTRCHFFLEGLCPGPRPPLRGQRLVKAPQCLLVHRTSSAHPPLTPALTVV